MIFPVLAAKLSSAVVEVATQLAQPPDPPPVPPPGLTPITNLLLSWMKWGVVVVGVIGLLTCAMMIIIGRRNRSAAADAAHAALSTQDAAATCLGGSWSFLHRQARICALLGVGLYERLDRDVLLALAEAVAV